MQGRKIHPDSEEKTSAEAGILTFSDDPDLNSNA